jgi:hypothetical protein
MNLLFDLQRFALFFPKLHQFIAVSPNLLFDSFIVTRERLVSFRRGRVAREVSKSKRLLRIAPGQKMAIL